MRRQIDEAIEVIREQKPEALEHALALLQDTVLAYSMKICGHREDAEDNAQEVLVRTARFLHDFDNPMALSVWLYKVARNQCLMKRRRSKHEGQQEVYDEALPDKYTCDNQVPPSPEELLLKLERAEQVLAHIRALPDQHRVVLTLHDLEELNTSEIAELLDTSEGSVRVRLHRARKLLREQLQTAAAPLVV